MSIPKVSPYLDWTQRPEVLKSKIDANFETIRASDPDNNWLFNGEKKYGICEIDEKNCLQKLIQSLPTERREFYILDVGAGDFTMGKTLAQFLNQTQPRPDAWYHIISVRGEQYNGPEIIDNGQCTNYNFGSFKVEEIFAELKKKGLFLEDKIDFVLSRWCFIHLVDPLGTLQQISQLQRPRTGLFFTDGFYFSTTNDGYVEFSQMTSDLIHLFSSMKVHFLVKRFDYAGALHHYIIQKPESGPVPLRMKYRDFIELKHSTIWSQCITRFEHAEETKKSYTLRQDTDIPYYGDQKLFDWLKSSDLLQEWSYWLPIDNYHPANLKK